MAKIFSNQSANLGIRRQRSRNSSIQFNARVEGEHDEGKRCSNCGVHDPNISASWVGHWNCEDCGGNVVSRTVTNGSGHKMPGSARRLKFARMQRSKKPEPHPINELLNREFEQRGTPKAKAKAAKPRKDKKREDAMRLLGLTEADIVSFKESK